MKTTIAKLAFCLLVSACFFNTPLKAQLGYIDTTYYAGYGIDFKAASGLVLPDSSVIVGGKFNYSNGYTYINGITRLDKYGNNDTVNFHPGAGANNTVNVVVRQPDGKLIIAGDFTMYHGMSLPHIARINADGSLDSAFDNNVGTGYGGANPTVYTVHLLANGKILVGGSYSTYNGTNLANISRLNPDGTIDNTFNTGVGTDGAVYALDVQPDSKIIVAGDFVKYNTDSVYRITRLDTNGVRDPTFTGARNFNGVTKGANSIITKAIVLPGSQIIIGGYFTKYNDSTVGHIARLYSNGTLDLAFRSASGAGSSGPINDMIIQPDGKIIATGNFGAYSGSGSKNLVRVDTSGARDATFAIGTGIDYSCNTVFLNLDGKVYVGGTFTQIDSFARIRFARLLTTGKVDQSFYYQSKLNGIVYALGYQSDGKLIVGGQFTLYNDVKINRIVRLNTDGSIDNTFNSGIGANNTIRAISVLPDDKILITGDFTKYNITSANRICRLKSDGSYDSTFVIGTGLNSTGYCFAMESSGKIYVGGNFTTYAGTGAVRMVRLNSTGGIDNTFAVGTGFNNVVTKIALEPDGSPVAVGSFTTFAGITVNRIVRLTTTGTQDVTFATGTGFSGAVNAIAIQSDGKIYTGGAFTTFNGASVSHLTRLNTNGSLDASFTGYTNNTVNDLAVYHNGLIAIGAFTLANGVSQSRIAFFNLTGGLDSSNFYVGTGFDGIVSIIANNLIINRSQRRIYIGGVFTDMQKHLANKLVRLKGTNINLTKVSASSCPGSSMKVYFNRESFFNPGNTFTVQLSDSTGKFNTAINIGSQSSGVMGPDSITVTIPISTPYGSNYIVRIISSSPADTSNISLPFIIAAAVPPTITAIGPSAICSGGTVTLSSSSADAYTWSTGATTQTTQITTGGNYTVTAVNGGCSSTSSPFHVTVNASPDSSILVTVSSLCGSGSYTLTAAPNLTYNWSTGATSQSITVNQSGNYTVTVTNSNGCVSDSTRAVLANSISSNLVSTNGPTTFCQGGSVQLSASPGYTYTWSNGATSQNINVTASGTFTVTASDGTCSASSNPITVTVHPIPDSTVTVTGPQNICFGGTSVTITAAAGANYSWSTSDTTQSITISNPGTYIVTLTNSYQCSSTATTIIGNAGPSNVVNTSGPTTFCIGNSVTLNSAAANVSYLWSSGDTTQSITVSVSGTFTVTVTDPGSNCTAASTAVVVHADSCTGINDLVQDNIVVYPNPATSVLFVSSTTTDISRIEVVDVAGNVVIKLNTVQLRNTVPIDISELSSGIYFVTVNSKKFRIIKTR